MSAAKNFSDDDHAPRTALILIDVINDLDFDGGEDLLEHALEAADGMERLKRRAQAAGTPVIYVNDRFGQWRSDFKAEIERCRQPGVRGRLLVERFLPDEDDYFILKPKYSGFFGTTLEVLLQHLNVTHLILTGLSGDVCVLSTAIDAYMRGYGLYVPSDCTASVSAEENQRALNYMRRVLDVDTSPAAVLVDNEDGWVPGQMEEQEKAGSEGRQFF